MRLVTILSLCASAALGLGALFVAKVVLPAQSPGATPAAAAAPPSRTQPVVVAAAPIAYGVRLEAKQLKIARYPADSVPTGAFSTIEQVLAQDGGGAPSTLAALGEREPLLPSRLSGPGARATIAAEIAEGLRAYTIRVSEVSGVGGHALPGDRVDVVLARDLSQDEKHKDLVSQVVIQNVRLLGVNLNADPTSAKVEPPNTATLEVSVGDAQKLSVAGDLGVLSLALRRTGGAEIAQVHPLASRDVVAGAALLRGPVSPAPRRTVPRAATSPRPAPLIVIVEGDGA
jgi:pilus assembly protein CpaB